MIKRIIKFFYDVEDVIEEQPKEENLVTLDSLSMTLIKDIETIINYDDLTYILKDSSVKPYILSMFGNIDFITRGQRDENSEDKHLIEVGSYFEGYEDKIYRILKIIVTHLKSNKLGLKQKSDVGSIVSMFKLYLEINDE